MKKGSVLLIISILGLFCTSSCSTRKERLTSNTLSIAIDPYSAQSMVTGSTLTLTAICVSPRSNDIDISPEWSVENNLGTFSKGSGKSTTFIAGSNIGTGSIFATYKGVIGQLSVTITSGNNDVGAYPVYSDAFAGDLQSPGAFWDYGDSILLSADTVQRSEGFKSFKALFTISAAGWAGWYIAASNPKDMSAYSGGYLKFDIKTYCDIQVGIRSANVNSNVNNAKRYVSQYANVDANAFVSVSIPISDLTAGQTDTDLSQIEDVFIASAIGSRIGAKSNGTFLIDNIRWALH